MEAETKHFGLHDHPLVLYDREKHPKIITWSQSCDGCLKSIFSCTKIYCCSNECDFFLHETCANLPLEIKASMHMEHPLNLLMKPLYTCFCNGCGKRMESFTYNCFSCTFDLCLECAHLALQERTIKHDSHQHSLTLLQFPSKFDCNACGKREINDLSYFCDKCPVWIHRSCASLPTTVHCDEDDHPLTLAYHLPVELHHYQFKCDVCQHKLNPSKWVYHCRRCRYFVHVKCMPSSKKDADHSSHSSSSAAVQKSELVSLPLMKDMLVATLIIFILTKQKKEIQLLSDMNHFGHEHPLILSNPEIDHEKGNYEETLCDACIEPISSTSPYYTCANYCGFLLHLSCANLPTQLEHPSHKNHQLSLVKLQSDDLGYFYCNNCYNKSNGFFYECKPCNYKLDLSCAVLPPSISHKAHNDHRFDGTSGSNLTCEACGTEINGLTYRCSHCYKYYLHPQCATLPSSVTHRWDKHLLMLMFPPFGDHPDEFYCEICEEEIHPKRWLYHCRKCDQSFHPNCIPPLGNDRFIKFGNTLKVDNHEHFLTSVRESRFKSSCSSCNKNLFGEKGFECCTCKFFLCYPCACKIPPKPKPKPVISPSECIIL